MTISKYLFEYTSPAAVVGDADVEVVFVVKSEKKLKFYRESTFF